MSDWKAYFTPPFRNDDYIKSMIWDSKDAMITTRDNAYDDSIDEDEIWEALVARMNKETPKSNISFANPRYVGTNCESYITFEVKGKEYTLYIRSWGYLITFGNCTTEEAAKVQDSLGEYIVECLK